MGANPIPHEVSDRYHADDSTDGIRERRYDEIVEILDAVRHDHYGLLADEVNVHLERVRRLVDENSECVKQADVVGNTMLHWAVNAGDVEMAHLLVERDSSIDARWGDSRGPSLVAIFGFHWY